MASSLRSCKRQRFRRPSSFVGIEPTTPAFLRATTPRRLKLRVANAASDPSPERWVSSTRSKYRYNKRMGWDSNPR